MRLSKLTRRKIFDVKSLTRLLPIIFSFLIALSYLPSSGQNLTLIDSLNKELKNAKGSNQFILLTAIGFEYRYSFPDSTIFYCTQSYELGKRLSLQKELSRPLSFIGLAYANKGDYKRSLDFHYQSIQVAEEQSDSVQLAYGYNNLGRMFFDEGDVVRAYDNFIRAKDIFEDMDEGSGLAYVYRSLSNVYKSQGDYQKALEMSKKAFDLRLMIGEPRTTVSALMELGLVYQELNEIDNAILYMKKADSLAAISHDRVTRADVKMGVSEILFTDHKFDEAFQAANEVLMVVTEQTNQKLFLRANMVRGKYFFQNKRFAEAIQVLKEILSNAQTSGNMVFQRDASFVLSEIYRLNNNSVVYNEYWNRYKMLNEKLQNDDLSRQIDRLQFQLEMEKKEKENDRLKAAEAQNIALIAQQRFQNISLVILAGFITLLAIFFWRTGRKRRHINNKLALRNQQIVTQQREISIQNENLSHRNEELQDINNEKDTLMSIVAHDLKSPVNRIFGLARLMEMEGGLPPQQQEYLKLIRNSTRAGLDLITDLLDVNSIEEGKIKFETFDLKSFLAELMKSFAIAADPKFIQIKLQNQIQSSVTTDQDYFSRILDNLISNAIKFSPSGAEIIVSLFMTQDFICLSVKDQGLGFSDSDKKFLFQKFKKLSARPTGGESSNGLGLAIVKTLVGRLNGTVELISAVGKGSEFIVKIPCVKAAVLNT